MKRSIKFVILHVMSRIEVLGVKIDNYSFRDAVLIAEEYLGNMAVNIVQSVSIDSLNVAEANEELKAFLESVDLTVISDIGILPIIGADSEDRIREIEESYFEKTFIRRIRETGKSVYLLAPSNEEKDAIEDFLKREEVSLNILNTKIVLDDGNPIDWEDVVNEINSHSVGIVISLLPVSLNQQLMKDYKDMLSIELFWGLGEAVKFLGKNSGIIDGIKQSFLSKVFHHKASKYSEE